MLDIRSDIRGRFALYVPGKGHARTFIFEPEWQIIWEATKEYPNTNPFLFTTRWQVKDMAQAFGEFWNYEIREG